MLTWFQDGPEAPCDAEDEESDDVNLTERLCRLMVYLERAHTLIV